MNFKTLLFVPVLAGMCAGTSACKRDATVAPETTAAVADAPPSGEAPESPGEVAVPDEKPAEGRSEASDAPASDSAPAGDPASAGPPKTAASQPLPPPLYTKVDDKCGRDPGVGTTALPFALKTADGKDLSMASLRGKVVLLNFWGTWCKPCLKELPEFDRLVRHYRKHGAVLVAVATDTDPEKVLEFARERKLAAKLVLGGEELAKQYDSPNFPFSFVVDDRGTIRGSYRSYKPECIGKIEQDIRTSLEQRRR